MNKDAKMKGRHQFRRRFSLQPSFMKEDHEEERRPHRTDRTEDTVSSSGNLNNTAARHKIVVLGAAKVGKSSLITQFLYNSFSTKYKRTVEEMHHGDFNVAGVRLTLDILDTSGSYEFPAMRALSMSSADAFILVYDISDAESFVEVRTLRDQIHETKASTAVPIVVVGNKVDLAETGARQVDFHTTESVVTVDWENGFVEASAKDNMNVSQIFKELLVQAKCNIGLNTSTWGPLIVHILLQKLDLATYNDYIQHLDSPRSLPDLEKFLKFLESRFMAMETIKTRNSPTAKTTNQNNYIQKNYNGQRSMNSHKSERTPHTYHASVKSCPLCKNTTHVLMQCRQFINMSVDERNDTVTRYQLCKNCLYSHGDKSCASTKRCFTCNDAHHTLLHQKNNTYPGMTQQANWPSQGSYGPSNRSTNHVQDNEREVLLTTALLMVRNQAGEYITLRALLDQGSQVSLITEEAAQRLRLHRSKISATISGVGVSMGNCKGLLSLNCKSLNTDYTFGVQALIMKKLIRNLPNTTFEKSSWSYLETLKLADPEFNVSNPVDILLGADVYSDIILDGLLKGETNTPVAQQTKLGWILCGNIKTFNCLVTLHELEDLSRFWETEEINNNNNSDLPTEDYCEKFYNETTTRDSDGRYVVKMPMKENYEEQLGISKNRAVSQFFQQERKMDRKNKLSQMYREFIAEYEQLGHMKPAPTSMTDRFSVYLPHHGVLRENSSTTKLRVVYNASMKTSTGLSLNDVMEKGPNLQKDLQTLLIKFRCYKYTLTADVEKMFRQILIHEDQQHLQKIVWRGNREQPLQNMVLCTVTYGTKSAPYLAMRTLKQLALDEEANYPNAAEKLINECNMDDVITGAPTIEGATQLQLDLSALLKKGGFHLRKWSSNDSRVLENIPPEECSTNSCLDFNQEESTKTLGISYNSLPRLELAGALLLSQFIEKIKSSLSEYELHIACWTDSQVVLAWQQGDVTLWVKYVANRVKQRTTIVCAKQWRYVKTDENPADCAIRGLFPTQAASFELWWNGPKWLKTTKIEHEHKTSQTFITTSTIECINNNSSASKNADTENVADYLLKRHSSLTRLARVTAWILRFTTAVRCKQTTQGEVLSSEELNRAMTYLIRQVQRENCHEEIENLKKRGTVNNKSSLLNLKPYLDEDGLLRVGGRLQHSSLPEESKHPVIPYRGKLTQLIIEDCHKKTIHSGENLPPGRWALGVQETHTGRDGYVRVVTLKTKNGALKRPILKLSPLPMNTASISGDDKEKQKTDLSSQKEKKSRKKTTLSCYFTILMTILASIGNVKSATTEEGYEMTPFKTEHPLYFDDIGKIQYIHDE